MDQIITHSVPGNIVTEMTFFAGAATLSSVELSCKSRNVTSDGAWLKVFHVHVVRNGSLHFAF